jgi:hypothetical protein
MAVVHVLIDQGGDGIIVVGAAAFECDPDVDLADRCTVGHDIDTGRVEAARADGSFGSGRNAGGDG